MRGFLSLRSVLLALIIAGFAGQTLLGPKVHGFKRSEKFEKLYTVSLPGKLVRLFSLDYHGLFSDILFLDLTVFFGDPKKVVDARFMDRALELVENITYLDPYFEDPYYIASGLVWEADRARLERINKNLEKATRYRFWGGWIPFRLGFNHFFFMNDYLGAARWLSLASERPDAPKMASNLAARMYVKAGKTVSSIIFLNELWQKEKDPKRKQGIAMRLNGFLALYTLEKAVQKYIEIKGRPPKRLEQLVSLKLIQAIPKDPFGGQFYLEKDAKVTTTSNFYAPVPKRKVPSPGAPR